MQTETTLVYPVTNPLALPLKLGQGLISVTAVQRRAFYREAAPCRRKLRSFAQSQHRKQSTPSAALKKGVGNFIAPMEQVSTLREGKWKDNFT